MAKDVLSSAEITAAVAGGLSRATTGEQIDDLLRLGEQARSASEPRISTRYRILIPLGVATAVGAPVLITANAISSNSERKATPSAHSDEATLEPTENAERPIIADLPETYDNSGTLTREYAEGDPIPEIPFSARIIEDLFTLPIENAEILSTSPAYNRTTFEYTVLTTDEMTPGQVQSITVQNGAVYSDTSLIVGGEEHAALLIPAQNIVKETELDEDGNEVYSYVGYIGVKKASNGTSRKEPTIQLKVRTYPYLPPETGTSNGFPIVFSGISPETAETEGIVIPQEQVDQTFRPLRGLSLDPLVQISRVGLGRATFDHIPGSDPIPYQLSITPGEVTTNPLWSAEQVYDAAEFIYTQIPRETTHFNPPTRYAQGDFELVMNELQRTNPNAQFREQGSPGNYPPEASDTLFSPTRYAIANPDENNFFSREETPFNGNEFGSNPGKFAEMTTTLASWGDQVSGLSSEDPNSGFLALNEEQQFRAKLRFTAWHRLMEGAMKNGRVFEAFIPYLKILEKNMLLTPEEFEAYVAPLRQRAT